MDANDRKKRVAEEAAEWWVVMQGDVPRAQREQYVDWLRESSTHVAEMLRVAQMHGALERFQGWSAIPIDGPVVIDDNVVTLSTTSRNPETARRQSDSALRNRLAWAVAATFLIIVTTIVLMQLRARDGIISTERGERREVALVDGSVVQVDPETRLLVKYEQHARRVFLERGRALFHVAKNTERPFLVQANDTTVRAVGTAFAVEKNDNATILITVAEGKVAVFPPQGNAPAVTAPSSVARTEKTPAVAPSSSSLLPSAVAIPAKGRAAGNALHGPTQSPGSNTAIFLTANEQVSVTQSGSTDAVHPVDSTRALAWAEGRLIFENSSVTNAVQQFNRYNRIQIVINDVNLAHRSISGTFSAADPESFAAFVQTLAQVRITHHDSTDITIDMMH